MKLTLRLPTSKDLAMLIAAQNEFENYLDLVPQFTNMALRLKGHVPRTLLLAFKKV
ncbi:MAG: hypothetical protein U0T83_02845 [Bacteriovoracaceae bacterium]